MSESITWVGLDVHKKFIQVAVLLPGQEQFEEWRVDRPDNAAAKRLAKRLVKMAPGEVRCCYEAGPCGYWLKRVMEKSAPLVCEVIAPSLIPRTSSDRIKTDRRDARKLAKHLRGGNLTEVRPPTEEEESARDLCRMRDDVRRDVTRWRQRLSKWLLRRGHHFPGKAGNWTQAHRRWMRSLKFDDAVSQTVLNEHLVALKEVEERLKQLTQAVDELAGTEPYAGPVSWLRAFHGIDTLTAISLIVELHGFRRFNSPRQLSSYLGLVPSEQSSGGKRRGGGITKTGNSHARRLLIEASWHYRGLFKEGSPLRKRREGVPAEIVQVARKAHRRLAKRRTRLDARGMHRNKVNAAVARELSGFIWAVLMRDQLAA